MFNNKIKLFFCKAALLAFCFAACKKDIVFQKKAKPESVIAAGDIRLSGQDLHFVKDTVYVLATSIVREANQQFTIDAGTLIKVNDKLSITIKSGATIQANGSHTDPIVFTSANYRGGVGIGSGASGGERFWYGIRLYGDAVNNPTGSSGILNFVRIEFAGGNEDYLGLPSLLLENIAAGTAVSNIQVSYSFETPSFQINGGNFNAKNLISYASAGNDFVLSGGYNAKLQNLLAYRHPFFGAVSGERILAGMLITGENTEPAISNLTVLGPDLQKGTNSNYSKTDLSAFDKARVAALLTTGAARFHIRNSVFLGFPEGGFFLDDASTANSLNDGESDFSYSIVHSNDSSRSFYLPDNVYPPYTANDFKNFLLQPQFSNQLFYNSSMFQFADPFNYDINPDPGPALTSPLLTGADFNTTIYSDPFFQPVAYRGAIGGDNWAGGWTNFLPLQTNYNN